MLSKSWAEALKKANEYRAKKKYRIAQQLNGEWYYLTMYKQGAAQTMNFESGGLRKEQIGAVDLGPLTGIRVWTNVESNGFDFQAEAAARESKYRLFGDDKRYTIVAGK